MGVVLFRNFIVEVSMRFCKSLLFFVWTSLARACVITNSCLIVLKCGLCVNLETSVSHNRLIFSFSDLQWSAATFFNTNYTKKISYL